jgi:signal transduction histidine kinase/ActR/RegA family two-component response regulator
MVSVSDLALPDAGTIRFKRLQAGVLLLGILVILLFAGSSAHDAWRSYHYALTATDRELNNMAKALAEQTVWSLQAVDLLLVDTAHWYRSESRTLPPDRIDAALAARAAAVQQVRQVTIMDAHGNQLFRSREFSAPIYNVADRSYFIAQRDDPRAGLFMSEPLTTRSEGRAAMILSRRLDDDEGRFAGVVVANVDLEDLNQFYRAVDVGAGGAIQLLRADGTLLVRNPRVPDAVGRKFPPLAVAPTEPFVQVRNPIDGRMDFMAVAPVRNSPLRLAVTRDAAVALQPWREETIRAAIQTLVVMSLSALTLAVMMRQIRLVASRQQLESQLRQSQKMEAIGTLAGGIAHDFNNMLGAILGYGELALQHGAADADLKRYLNNVMHAAERAKLLVERILGFSRSGLGDSIPVNVQSVVEETLELLEASLPQGIRIDSTLQAGTAAVMGDPTYLHQVTMNLCTNAVQAMNGDGALEVAVERVALIEPRTLSRGSLGPGDYVRLTVVDTGAGMPPAILERMFDPFFTTKKVGEGTGLGLSVVHGIVADLGGAIHVTSKVGRGTRFEVWLPVAGEAGMPTLEASDILIHGHGETLLIVDDERPLVALAEEIVARLGYEPVGFVSSRAALEAFRAAPDRFDAVLTDESMPELTGTELVRQIRILRPAIPIILMSGHGDAALVSRASEAAIGEVLRKPLRARDMALGVARALESARCPGVDLQTGGHGHA